MRKTSKLNGLLSLLLVLSLLVIPLVSAKDVGISTQWIINGQVNSQDTITAQRGDKVEFFLTSTSADVDYSLRVSLMNKDTNQKVRDLWAVNHLYDTYNKEIEFTILDEGNLYVLSKVYSTTADAQDVLYLNVPTTPVTCPDADNDGVCDSEDVCPEVAGAIANDGCLIINTNINFPKVDKIDNPIIPELEPDLDLPEGFCVDGDNDGDGICNGEDSCPEEAGLVILNGCPWNKPNPDIPDIPEPKIPDIPDVPYIPNPFDEENNTAPLVIVRDYQVTETETLTFNVNSYDANGDSVTYEATTCINQWFCPILSLFGNDLPEGAAFNENTGQFVFTPDYEFVQHPETQKEVVVYFRAYDGEDYSLWVGSEINVLDLNRAPQITSMSHDPNIITTGDLVEFQSSAEDADGDNLIYIWSFSDSRNNFNGQDVSHAFTKPGFYTARLIVRDNYGGQDERTLNLRVYPTNIACPDVDGDGICDADEVADCTDPTATNYNPAATDDDGSCTYAPCSDVDNDGVCDVDEVAGCTDPTATNYNPAATDDDGSCTYAPCSDVDNDGVCDVDEVAGCTDATATNYNPAATDDDGSCTYAPCSDVDNDDVCDVDEVAGCTDATATNYNPAATDDDGSCILKVYGCMDESATNYNSLANVNDLSCVYTQVGLKMLSVHLADEDLAAGETAVFAIKIENYGDVKFNNMRVSLVSYDLGFERSSSEFNLNSGAVKNLQLVVDVPEDAQPGEHLVKIWVGNDQYHEVQYRQIVVE